jgi:hypothetical protein
LFSRLRFFAKEKAMRLAAAHVLHIRRGQNSWPNGRRWRKKTKAETDKTLVRRLLSRPARACCSPTNE